jgi:hypothetical protein
MKKLMIALFFLGALSIHASAAEEQPICAPVLKSFQATFTAAKDVNWEATSNSYKVSFLYNNQHITAFYNCDGKLAAVTKNLATSDLPLLLETSLKEQYHAYWITGVVEFSSKDETSYYVTVENADEKVVLKSSQNTWTVFRIFQK